MKKTAILIFLGVLFLIPDSSQASDDKSFSKSEIQKSDGGGHKNKSGSYRKKKGFMWGIFKGKSQCDCPKH